MDSKIVITRLSDKFSEKYNINKVKYASLLFNDNKLEDIKIHEPDISDFSCKDIFVSRIINIDKRINAAMLNIYNNDKVKQAFFSLRNERFRNIKSGSNLLLQIVKDEIKTKPLNVSTDIEIADTYFIMQFEFNKIAPKLNINISSRITDEEYKGNICNKIIDLFNNEIADEAEFIYNQYCINIIIRTVAYDEDYLSEKTLNKIKEKILLFYKIYKQSLHMNKCDLVYKSKGSIYDFINSYSSYSPLCITDIEAVYNQICSDFNTKLYEDKLITLNNLYSVDNNVAECFDKKVWLKSGAYIIIESTEAANIIDVNTGKNIKKYNDEKLYYEVNKEAAIEIARQIRLRELSGIILIDFINMKDNNNINNLIFYLKEEFKKDKNKCDIFGMTKLQLLEMTRQVKYPNIYSQIYR